MAAYLMLGIPFVAVAFVCASISGWRPSRSWALVLSILIVMTAIFDSLIIHFDIVGYDYNKTIGLRIGKAPIEDFLYCLAVALLVPVIWKYSGSKLRSEKKDE